MEHIDRDLARTGKSASEVPFGKRLKSLDGLRGIAVLAVVAFHTLRIESPRGLAGGLWAAVQESTWAGVDLFFVLSGFLITGILLDSRDERGYFINFYARRTLRIFPLYYAVLGVALILVPTLVGLSHLPSLYPRLLQNQFWLWTYLANFLQAREAHTLPGFGHFWSLAVEEQFYWFWPLVVFWTPRKLLLQLCLALCCILPVLRFALLEAGVHPWALRQWTFTRFDTLLFGAVVAILIRDPRSLRQKRLAILVLASIACLTLLWIGSQSGFVPFEGPHTVVEGYSALGIMFAAIIFHLASKQPDRGTLLTTSTLRWFGKYSYGIYVMHWPVAQAIQSPLTRRLLPLHSELLTVAAYFGAVLMVSSIVAWLSWNLFEVHFLKLKRFFEYRGTPSETARDKTKLSAGVPSLDTHPSLVTGSSTPLPL